MYLLGIIIVALVLISLVGTNWPLKLVHYRFLKQLADEMGALPERNNSLGSSVYAEIKTIYHEKMVRIRFVEGSADSLRSSSGLEIRLIIPTGVVVEIAPAGYKQREWGHFRRFLSGDPEIDARWFMLTDDPDNAARFWQSVNLKNLLLDHYHQIGQLSINHEEIVVRLKRWRSPGSVVTFLETLIRSFL